jgi:hypothetical protein
MPALPVLLQSLVRNPLVVPPVAIPIMVSVVSSPTWIYIKIKTWNMAVIDPSPVIVMGAIPTSFPRTPPPPIPEEQINVYIRSNVNIVRIRDHYHLRRCRKCDEWWKRNMDANLYPCQRWNRNAN